MPKDNLTEIIIVILIIAGLFYFFGEGDTEVFTTSELPKTEKIITLKMDNIGGQDLYDIELLKEGTQPDELYYYFENITKFSLKKDGQAIFYANMDTSEFDGDIVFQMKFNGKYDVEGETYSLFRYTNVLTITFIHPPICEIGCSGTQYSTDAYGCPLFQLLSAPQEVCHNSCSGTGYFCSASCSAPGDCVNPSAQCSCHDLYGKEGSMECYPFTVNCQVGTGTAFGDIRGFCKFATYCGGCIAYCD